MHAYALNYRRLADMRLINCRSIGAPARFVPEKNGHIYLALSCCVFPLALKYCTPAASVYEATFTPAACEVRA
jgi:hypothetical protein